jgi:hypothetical protein
MAVALKIMKKGDESKMLTCELYLYYVNKKIIYSK